MRGMFICLVNCHRAIESSVNIGQTAAVSAVMLYHNMEVP